MKSAPQTCAIESASSQALRRMFTPTCIEVARRTSVTRTDIAATVTGGTLVAEEGDVADVLDDAGVEPGRLELSRLGERERDELVHRAVVLRRARERGHVDHPEDRLAAEELAHGWRS